MLPVCVKINYVLQGVQKGKRPELTGGGLIRSSGGRSAIKSLRRANIHMKSDERILADLSSKLNISQPAVSISVRRGEQIVSESGYLLVDEEKLII